jgi:cystathionine gamma-synthase
MDDCKPNWSLETRVARGSRGQDPLTGSISFPIYQSATFRHPGLDETTGWDYSRQGNPTRSELEETLCALEGGARALAFTTGMAAISAVLDLLSSGDGVILSEDLYGGTYRLFDELARKRKIAFAFVDTRDLEAVRRAVDASTKLLIVETPSNPMARISDIAALAVIAHNSGCLLAVDNTFLTPLFQRPIELGADIVVHSGTKFLGGHNDTLCGFAVAADSAIGERLYLISKTTGAILSPFDSWLILRGMKTLALRLRRQQETALLIARFLKTHPAVEAVYYAGLPDHPQYELSRAQASGFGAMISFRVRDKALVARILSRVKLILFAESLGGVETLITFPFKQTHSAIPLDLRERLGVDERLLRISVGIEDPADLIADLERALRS